MAVYRPKDSVYRTARAAGLRSRAAVKLEEIDQRFKLFRRGQRVLDLGAWPGGWLQIAANRVGPSGRVVGVDLEPIEPLGLDHVATIVGDARSAEVRASMAVALGGPADVLLCDMAPKLSGVKAADRARHLELAEAAIGCASHLLAPGGKAVIKLFSGVEGEAVALLRTCFESVSRFRPPATRKGSQELYAVAERPRPSSREAS